MQSSSLRHRRRRKVVLLVILVLEETRFAHLGGMKGTTTRHREAHRARGGCFRLGVWGIGLRLRIEGQGRGSWDLFSSSKTSRGTTYTARVTLT